MTETGWKSRLAPTSNWGSQSVSETALLTLEKMLDEQSIAPAVDGGLIWSVHIDGHSFSLTLDRHGRVRASSSY